MNWLCDPAQVEEIERFVQEVLTAAEKERWTDEELKHELAGAIFCAYRVAELVGWLRSREYTEPLIRFQNHVVEHAARETVKRRRAHGSVG